MSVKLSLRILKHANVKHGGKCIVWITGQEGPTCFGIMNGVVSAEIGDLLEQSLNIPCERQETDAEVSDSFIEDKAEETKKGHLF